MTSDISLSSPNLLPQEDADYLCSLIRTIPDFPSEGILFRDFMPVFAQAKSMNLLIQGLDNEISEVIVVRLSILLSYGF